MLSEFAKVFEWKVLRVQLVHLHSAGCALSSPSRCFQSSTNLDKYFFSLSLIYDTRHHSGQNAIVLEKESCDL